VVPAWRDPRYLSEIRLHQFEAHEDEIRRRERERERRRLMALIVKPEVEYVEDPYFPGCVW
jgi:hypothetical protein